MKIYKFFLAVFVFFVILAVFAPFFAPFDPNFSDFQNVNLAPSQTHIFGTDFMGRDLLSRVFYALRTSLIVGVGASFITTLIASFYAYIATLNSNFIKEFFDRLIDAFLSLPSIIFIMIFSSISGGRLFAIILIIGLCSWMQSAKVILGALKTMLKSDFIAQAKINGATHFKLIFFEALPNLKALLFTLFGINAAHAIAMEATLSFFGVGSDLSAISLGLMLNESTQALFMGSWWVVLFPGAVLFLLILSFAILSTSSNGKGIKI